MIDVIEYTFIDRRIIEMKKLGLMVILLGVLIPMEGKADCRKEIMVDSIELDGEYIERSSKKGLNYGAELVMNDEMITSLEFEGVYKCIDGRYIRFVGSDTLVKMDCDGNLCQRSF